MQTQGRVHTFHIHHDNSKSCKNARIQIHAATQWSDEGGKSTKMRNTLAAHKRCAISLNDYLLVCAEWFILFIQFSCAFFIRCRGLQTSNDAVVAEFIRIY